ncbi:tRNA pseudouridine(38/39) synthase [Anoplophora glabripennis]|uniref:tRNA pseudouridine(38/39) synthase n=1 Tax=Anoplophora glabripennis TaxID=217634 RepID=UPI000874AABD|nr:tRNA pseudouridine(38/39) synthase [Anoplophora glabripennis]
MDQKVCIKKQNKSIEFEELEKCTKEELIERIKTLSAHNTQLKNIIAKTVDNSNRQVEHKNLKSFDFSKCNLRHVALKIFYLGWDYKGYVTQEDTTNTIEHYIFEALIRTRLIKDRTSSNYHRCGRTDKGVSSFAQTISIDVRSSLTKDEHDRIDNEINYCKILNKVLPDNIQCIAWSPVNASFSARFDCKTRTYKYFFPKGNLDIEKMRLASDKLLGTHDFRNFCKMDVGNGVVEFIRNVLQVDIYPVNENDLTQEYSMYAISIKGKAFLWHQIRCIMGILFLIGQNKEEPSVIDELFDVKQNPRKPEYNMANEIPLNLFCCEYDDIKWHYNEESLSQVIDKLNTIWTYSAAKESMIKEMVRELNEEYLRVKTPELQNDKYLGECLLQGVKSRKYTPIMKRPTCDSLEDKIKHFAKRNRIEVIGGEPEKLNM